MTRATHTLIATLAALVGAAAAPGQFTDAWLEYAADPDRHPNIPNVSHAGYKGGGVPLPDGSGTTLIAVTSFGATPNDSTDDTAAIRAAIEEAGARANDQPGGSVVFFPPGTYRLSGPLLIHHDNVQLRGFDRDACVLLFTESLTTGYAAYPGSDAGDTGWSFTGGLIWFTDESRNPYFPNVPTISRTGEGLRLSSTRNFAAPASLGDRTISIATTSGLAPGDTIVVEIDNHSDLSTLRHLLGDGQWANSYDFNAAENASILPANRSAFRVYHSIESIDGNTITLREPLRFDCRTAWDPEVRIPGDLRRDVGIANLTIQMDRDYEWTQANHNKEVGWNGVKFADTIDAFADNLRIIDVDGLAVMFQYAKNVTAQNIIVEATGPDRLRHHHAFACANSADCLYTDFEVRSRPLHGIYFGNFSVNNVYSNGTLEHGTFDYHKLMPYSNIYTNIDIFNDGQPGGGTTSGPPMAARHAHWNIAANRTSSSFIGQPDIMPKGALVGVTCCHATQSDHPRWGESQALIENTGFGAPRVNPPNLYEAQLALRLGNPIPTDATPSPCQGCEEDAVYTFDFQGNAGANLIGQDNWVMERDFAEIDGNNVQLVVDNTHPDAPVFTARSTDGRDSVISRQNDPAYSFTPPDFDATNAVLRFDARAGASGGPSGNIYLIVNNAPGRDEGIQFGMSNSQFQIRGGRFNGVLQETASIPSGWYSRGDWAQLELHVDLVADRASLFFKNLTDGDTNFRPVTALQNVPLNGQVAYPETWDRIEFRIRNESAATNLIANLSATQKCCELDASNDGAFDPLLDIPAFAALLEIDDDTTDLNGDAASDFLDMLHYLELAGSGCL